MNPNELKRLAEKARELAASNREKLFQPLGGLLDEQKSLENMIDEKHENRGNSAAYPQGPIEIPKNQPPVTVIHDRPHTSPMPTMAQFEAMIIGGPAVTVLGSHSEVNTEAIVAADDLRKEKPNPIDLIDRVAEKIDNTPQSAENFTNRVRMWIRSHPGWSRHIQAIFQREHLPGRMHVGNDGTWDGVSKNVDLRLLDFHKNTLRNAVDYSLSFGRTWGVPKMAKFILFMEFMREMTELYHHRNPDEPEK